MEQMDDNLLFRWFVGLGMDDAVWVPTVFTKNRDRLLTRTCPARSWLPSWRLGRWHHCCPTITSRSMALW